MESTVVVDIQGCRLFDSFGLSIQVLLAFAAFGSLLFKRKTEFPCRPWKIWVFDTSKQGMSALLSHGLNTSLGIVFGQGSGDVCTWYLIHSALDTFLGVFINFILLRFLERAGSGRFSSFESGFYGHPPSVLLWLKQLFVWLIIVFISKIIIVFIVLIDQYTQANLETIGKLMLYPFHFSSKLEMVFVMLVFPFFLNVFVFWVQDGFLKKNFKQASASWITYASLESSVSTFHSSTL